MKRLIQTVAVLLTPVVGFTQTAPPVAEAGSSGSWLWWLLLTAMIVLLFAAFVLGNVLVKLTQMAMEKRKGKTVLTLLLLLVSSIAFAQPETAVAKEDPFTANLHMTLAIIVLGCEMLVVGIFVIRIMALLNELSGQKEKVSAPIVLPKLFDSINASVAVEKEHDILLHHNYDGIRELDNNLPPWWKYSFYISIVWAVVYLSYYHVMGGPGMIDEYNKAVAEAQVAQEEYARLNKSKVDENNVMMADAAGILEGADLFKTNCAACHGNAGEGNAVGPNLTDDYWLHGGSLNHIFKSIKYGWSAKGMKAWETDLSASQIRNVASYIRSLRGTNPPNAKEPQGDLYNEETSRAAGDTAAVNSPAL